MKYTTNKSLSTFLNSKQYSKLFSMLYLLNISFLIYYLDEFQSKAIPPIYFILILTFTVITLISEIIILEDKYRFLILSKIYFFTLILHYIFIIPTYELFGYDSYPNFSFIWFLRSNLHIGTPNLQILFMILENITNINILYLIKYIPSVYTSISVIFVYLISKLFFETKPSLLSSLLYSSVHYYAMFHSWFVKEGLAFLLFLIIIYILLKQLVKIEYSILIVILGFSIVLSHHLTPFLLCIYLLLAYLTNYLLNNFYNFSSVYMSEKSRLLRLLELISTILLAYWIYEYIWPLYNIVESLTDPAFSGITPSTFQPTTYLLLRKYGYWILVFIFGILTTLHIYNLVKNIRSPNKYKRCVYVISIYVYAYLLSSLYFIGNYSIIPSNLAVNRLFTFAWVFLLIIGIPYIFYHKKYSSIFALIIGLYFVLFNVLFLFPHYAYSPYNPKLMSSNEIDFQIPQSQIYAERWSNISGNIITGSSGSDILSKNEYQFNRSIIGDTDYASNLEILQGNFSQIHRYNWIYIYSDMYNAIDIGKTISLDTNYSKIIGSNEHIILVYQNNKNSIYKIV